MDDFRSTYREGNKSELIALVKKAAAGDYEAFGKLYAIFVTPIYRYVFYQVKDKMTAEDVTEEVFLKAWKAMPSCCGKEATFSSWLYRIAHNQVVDVFRSQQKHVPLELAAEVPSMTHDGEIRVEHQELLNAIARLPEDQRRIIVLKFIQGMGNQEISQVTGKSEGAIRILQMRALAQLRETPGQGRLGNGY